MSFVAFAQGFGLMLDHPIRDGRWHRVKTVDHPRKRNGAYAYWGDRGAVQNWATMDSVAVWREKGAPQTGGNARAIIASAQEDRRRHLEARKQATALLAECDRAQHPYLARKGFPAILGLVHPSGDLMVPMRDHRNYEIVNSVQRISTEGAKKFIHGGKAKGSVFRIGSRGPLWLVEGYATGLSVHAALADMHQPGRVLVCFSAGNLQYVAQFIQRPAFVFADNDASSAGRKAAESAGFPYCMWGEIGDANDLMLSKGLRAVCSLMLDAQNSDIAA